MSEIATGVVKLTLGFLANKIRDGIVQRLKDGDVTDEVCRRLIVRELDDIKSKLDGLARGVLLSSFYFLEEGVNRLFQSPLHVDSNANTAKLPSLDFTDTGSESDYFMNEAVVLINALASLKIRSNDRFKSAIESFKLAREKATDAFANEDLSIEDRIQASQVRMIARILENLEDPEASASDCLQYLKQLHAIRAVRKIFSALINGGIKSKFNKTKRKNNATSVQVTNEILFEFIKKFTNSSLLAWMFAWPTIPLGEKTHHPLFGEYRHIKKLERSGVQVMSLDSDFTFGDEIFSVYLSVVNSKGNIVALTRDKRAFKVFKRSGESRILCKAPAEERRVRYFRIMAMDIDAKDNLYVIILLKSTPNESWNFKLLMFDGNGNKKLESTLPFRAYHYSIVLMAIRKDGKIAVLNCGEEMLYIYNVTAELNSVFVQCERTVPVANSSIDLLRFSSRDGAIVAASFQTVYVYKENGVLQSTFEKPTEHEEIRSIAINHATKCILVKTYQPSIGFTLLSFSATGEKQNSLCLGFRDSMRFARLISHPNGPVALVHETGAILLQL